MYDNLLQKSSLLGQDLFAVTTQNGSEWHVGIEPIKPCGS